MYKLMDKASGQYFVNPSFWSWDLTRSESRATTFETAEEAYEVKEAVNRAIGGTYWDYTDTVPDAVVVKG